ncbi:hypothetical protein GDO86_018198 [Hymenochirus boettgeri]|uniref:Uncharacterized protein n=1 Tax=Hymenochirus boettgeri TaxID=247094 RepID=A0A8T2IB56_9PIPI|nr:hypothetical protein GDO86_018198 [Hymenochirus boettgeri]
MLDCGPCKWLREKGKLPRLVVVVVFLAFLLDNLLLTIIVPIVPSYLYDAKFENISQAKMSSTSPPAPGLSYYYDSLLNSKLREILQLKAETNQTRAQCQKESRFLPYENVQAGLLIASKSIVQLLLNPLVSLSTNRIGYDLPMCFGFIIILLSILSE